MQLMNSFGNSRISPYYKEALKLIEVLSINGKAKVGECNAFYSSTFDFPDVPHYDPTHGLVLLLRKYQEGAVIPLERILALSCFELVDIAFDITNGVPYEVIAPFFSEGEDSYTAFRTKHNFDEVIEEQKSKQDTVPIRENSIVELDETEFTESMLLTKQILDSRGFSSELICHSLQFQPDEKCLLSIYSWLDLQFNFLHTIYKTELTVYYQNFLVWFILQCSSAQLNLLCTKYREGLISPLVFVFHTFYERKSGFISPLFDYSTLYYVKVPIDSFSINTNKTEWVYDVSDSVFLDYDPLVEILVDSVRYPLVIELEYSNNSLKIIYNYDLNGVATQHHCFHVEGKPFTLREWCFKRDVSSINLPISMNSIYVLVNLKEFVDTEKILPILTSSDIMVKNALFNATCAIKLGDKTYKQLLSRDDIGLPVFRLLAFYVSAEDSIYGALLRYLSDLLGMFDWYSQTIYPMDIEDYIVVGDNTKVPLLLLLTDCKRALDIIHEADYLNPILERRGLVMYLVEGGLECGESQY